MSRHNKIGATLAGTLAALAIGTSGAGAMPIQAPQENDAGHASIAQEQSATQAASRTATTAAVAEHSAASHLNLSSPDARDAAIVRVRPSHAHPALPALQAPQFSSSSVTALHSTQPPVKQNDSDIPWLTIVLGIGGAALLGGAGAVAVTKTTRSRRARVVA